MIGYKWAQLYVDGKMEGPSYGNHLPGPVLPKKEDRTGDHYEIRAGNTMSLMDYVTIVREVRTEEGWRRVK